MTKRQLWWFQQGKRERQPGGGWQGKWAGEEEAGERINKYKLHSKIAIMNLKLYLQISVNKIIY